MALPKLIVVLGTTACGKDSYSQHKSTPFSPAMTFPTT